MKFCKPCRTTTECQECWGEPTRPSNYFDYQLPGGWFRSTPGMYCCGKCRGTGKAPITNISF